MRRFGLNTLLEVSDDDEIVFIPWASDIVQEIRDEERVVIIDPPDGLRDLNK